MISALFFRNTISVQRATVTKDVAGGAVRSFASVANLTGIAAAIQPASASDIALYSGRQIQISHSVYLQSDPGIRRGDRLLVDDGRKFSVRGVLDAASFGRVYKIVCRELMS